MSDPEIPLARKSSAGRGACLVFAVAFGATCLMAAPVILSPSERIFGSGEILSREDPNRDALVVIEQFRTGRVPPPYLQPLTDLPGRALAGWVGPVRAYNLLVLASFPLAASTAYLLARYLLIPHLGAMVAGLAYSFLPFHVMQAGGHPHVAQTQWLPLYLLALWACADRPGVRRAGLLLLAAAAVSLADFYAGFIAAVLSPIALLAYGLASPRASGKDRGRRLGWTTLALTGAAILGVGAIRSFAPSIASNPGASAFARSELFTWSARWWSYLVPPADHPIWGPWVSEFWKGRDVGPGLLEHQQVSLPLSLVFLSLVPLWTWLRGDRETCPKRVALALATLGAVALFCSLSPERTILWFTFARPSAILYSVAPMFRAYARFGVVIGLMTSLLAGAGAVLLFRAGRSGRTAATLLLAIAAVECAPFPPWRSRDLLPTSAHHWLRRQAGPLKALDCTDATRVSDTLTSALMGHPVSLLGGPGLEDCGEPGLGEKLGVLGYTHVIVRRDSLAGSWLAEDHSRFAKRVALTPVIGFEDAWVLSPPTSDTRIHLETWSGFYPRESEGGRTWRWMADAGIVRFASADAPEATLRIELRSFPGKRRVAWSVDGRRLGELDLTPQWRFHELRLGPVGSGGFALRFECLQPAVVAQSVLGNRDSRTLGLAVGEWTFKGATR